MTQANNKQLDMITEIDLALEPRIMFDGAGAADIADEILDNDNALLDLADLGLPEAPAADVVSIFVIDAGVENIDELRAALPANAEVLVLDQASAGFQQIAEYLEGRSDIDALHIFSHGTPGALELGSSTTTLESLLGSDAAALEQIGQALGVNGDILIYGCDFGAGSQGGLAISTLATLTGADVTASDDVTGKAERGGDWDLEVAHGAIEASAIAALSYSGTLAVEATDGTVTIKDIETAGTITLTNDGGAEATTNVGTPRGVEHMVERVWLYDEDVDTGEGTIVFDISGITGTTGTIASDFGIIISDQADLSGDPLVLRASGADFANGLIYFHKVNIANGSYIGFATQTETDNISIDPVIVLDEEDIVDLGLVVQPALTDGGKLPDTFETAVGYRASNAGSTPTEFLIPAGTTNITITAFSNEPDDTSGNNARNDDYQTMNVAIDLGSGTSGGSVAYIIDQGPSRNDQFGWADAPLGSDVLSGGGTISGNTGSNISPTFSIEDGVLKITENTGLQTSYLVEFQTTLNTSANFLGSAAGLADKGDTSDIIIEIPAGVDVIKINQTDAAAGSHSAIEYKGFSKHYIDVGTGIGSGAVMAQLGETNDRVGAFAYEDYAIGPQSLQNSTAFVVGDTGSSIGANNDLTYFINGDGDLVIQRDSLHAAQFSSMFTVEFYERVDLGSSADAMGVVSDEAFFDANPTSGEAELAFAVPEGAQLGIMNLSLGGTRTSNENENMGGSFAIIDLANGTTSGNFFNVRVSNTVDLLSWESVPFGTTMFDVVTGASTDGEASSNKSNLNQFRDEFGARARFEIETAADGSQTVKMFTDSRDGTQTYLDYNAFAQVQWLGSEPIKLTGLPAGGSFNIGADDGLGNWVVDINEAATDGLFFTPPTHFSGELPLTLNVSVGPESDSTLIIQRPVLDPISFDTSDVTGNEDTDIPINAAVAPTFVDDDGSETATSTILSGLTIGHTISDGTNTFTASSGSTTVDVSSWTLSALTYNAGPDVFGDFDVTVTVNYQDEGAGQVVSGSDSDVFTVHVLPVNDPPTATNETYSAVVGVALNVPAGAGVLSDETDPEGDTLNAALVSGPNNGTLTLNPDGSFTYTATSAGNDSFTYDVSDGNGGVAQATTTIIVDLAPPPAPVAINETENTTEDTAITFDALSNDTVNSAGVSFGTGVNGPQNGTVVQNANGTFTYTPDPDFEGPTDSFQYTLTNVTGSSTATVTINITPANDPPVALPDSVTTPEDTAINVAVLGNDSDIDAGDTLTIVGVTAGTNITPSINAGTSIDFTPAPNWSGTETFTYTIEDTFGAQTTSTVTVTVIPELDAPDSTDKVIAINEDTAHVITFDAGTPANGDIDFTDPDTGNTLQSVSFAAPSSGSLLIGGVPVSSFPVSVSVAQLSAGQVSFLPATNETTSVTLDFTVNDGQLADTAANTLTFNISPVNDPITTTGAGLPDQALLDGQTGVSIATSAAFVDVDLQTITYDFASITNAAGAPVTAASLGLQINAATGEITENVGIDHLASDGGPYVVTIEATSADTSTATESFLLNISNPVPTAANGGAYVYDDGQTIIPIAIDTLFSDPDGVGGAGGDTLTISLDSGTLPGGLVYSGGQITGTLAATASANATYTVVFKAVDEQGAETTTSVSFTINNPVPKLVVPPVDLNQQSIDAQTITALDLSTAFIDDDTLTFTSTGLPAGLTMAANGMVTGTLDNSASQGGVSGAHTVIVVARDPQGQQTETSFTWIVTNPAPTSSGPQTIAMQDSQTQTVDLDALFSDSDVDVLTFSVAPLAGGPVPGPVSVTTVGGVSVLQIVADTDASQTAGGVYTLVVTADDGEGGTVSERVEVTVTNPPPVVDTPIGNQTSNDADIISLDIGTLFDDVDADTITITDGGSLPPGLSVTGTTISGTLAIDASQTGSPYTVTLTATDSDGDTGTYTFQWTVENPAPTAGTIPDIITQDGQTAAVDLATAGFFTDADGDPLTYTLASDHPGITLVFNGAGSFDIMSDDVSSQAGIASDGVYTLTATATDADGASVQQTFTVTVENVAPTATGLVDQAASDLESVNLDLAALGGFVDGAPDSDTLTYSTTSTLPSGLMLSAAGVLSGTLDHLASAGSPYVITIEASDSQGGTASESFVFTVTNPAPTVTTPISDQTVLNGEVVNLNASTAFDDTDGDNAGGGLDDLTYTATGLPGNLTIDANTGLIAGTVADTQGSYSVFVTATDEQGASVTDSFIINLDNSPPVSLGIANQALIDDQAMTPLDVKTAFTDPDGDGLNFVVTGQLPAGLSLVNGVISGTPDIDASQGGPTSNGTYPITVTAEDNSGAQAIQNFIITVTNPVPTANALPDQTVQDAGSVNLDLAVIGAFVDEDALTYTLETGPAWLQVSATGVLTGTAPIDASATSPYPVAVRATDADGASIVRVFNLNVENPVPVTAGLPNVAYEDGDTIALDLAPGGAVGFSDPDGDNLTYTTTSVLPDGLMLNAATGQIFGTIGNLASDTGTYPISVTATDAEGASVTDTFTITVTNPAPLVVGTLSDVFFEDGETISIPTGQVFTDAPDGDTVTFQVGGLPVGLTIDEDTGVISGTLPINASVTSPFLITVLAEDQQGAQTETTFTLNVGNIAPVAAALPDITATDSESISLNVTGGFSDADGDVNAFSVTGLPAGLSFDPATGLITGTIDKSASQSGPYRITVTADDNEGGVASTRFELSVVNPAPVVAIEPANLVIKPGIAIDTVNLNVFTDPDGDDLSLSVTGLPPGLAFDPVTGLLSGSPDNTLVAGSIFTVTLTATDADGARTSVTFTIQLDEDSVVQQKPESPLGARFSLGSILARFGFATGTEERVEAPLLDSLDQDQPLSLFGKVSKSLPILATVDAFEFERKPGEALSDPNFTNSFPITFAISGTGERASGLTANVIIGDERVFYQITSLEGADIKLFGDDVPSGVFLDEDGVLVLPRWMSESFTILVETSGPDGVTLLEIKVDPQLHQFEIFAEEVRSLLFSERLNWQPSLY